MSIARPDYYTTVKYQALGSLKSTDGSVGFIDTVNSDLPTRIEESDNQFKQKESRGNPAFGTGELERH